MRKAYVTSLRAARLTTSAPAQAMRKPKKAALPHWPGDTQTGARKPATTETGLVVTVPIFVEEGDTIRVDTRTGEDQTRV